MPIYFKTVGRMGIPGFSCMRCGCPFPPEKLYKQDELLVCRRHLFKRSKKEREAIAGHPTEYNLSDGALFGGRVG